MTLEEARKRLKDKTDDWELVSFTKVTEPCVVQHKCGTCKHYIGCGDWNLCCDIPHPTPKEKEMGMTFIFGHLCYEDTGACDMYEPKGEILC